jgi:hypothetical protein
VGIIGWSLAFVALVAGAGAGLVIFEGIVPALPMAAGMAVALWRLKAANDRRSAAREALVGAALGPPLPGPTWLDGEGIRDRTSYSRPTREGSAP